VLSLVDSKNDQPLESWLVVFFAIHSLHNSTESRRRQHLTVHAARIHLPHLIGKEVIYMPDSIEEIRSLNDLRTFIHHTLCEKENLLEDQFKITEMQLFRCGRDCGLRFSLNGPRSVRLGAIWAADQNMIYFYDTRGNRYMKLRLRHRLLPEVPEAIAA
jgi:hypothetical protein